MVALPQGYCIDSTEVTRGQYAQWLATSPSIAAQDDWCSFNTDFEPSCDWPGTGKENRPVGCVDWCDAQAYCKAAGKRLCGKIGGAANDYLDYADASKSQWYSACVSGTTSNAYTYGNTYNSDKCNGKDKGIGEALDVGTLPFCQSTVTGYSGVYDLSGNVWEWEDSCNFSTGSGDLCRLRGSSFAEAGDMPTIMKCNYVGVVLSRLAQYPNIGIRCCAEL